MTGERYALLGVARARAAWFAAVGRWSTSAALPAQFVRCVSVEEATARLASGRPFSAILLDGALPAVDRDLIARATGAGCAVLIVEDGGFGARAWRELGAAAVLPSDFSREDLLELLTATARMVGGPRRDVPSSEGNPASGTPPGRLIAVTGPGGTGASVAAIALAQGIATEAGPGGGWSAARASEAARGGEARPPVLLADLCRTADQAMFHDSGAVVPGVQELVESHRVTSPTRDAVLDHTFDVPVRGYRLLLGLRRPRDWVTVRPHAFGAGLDALVQLVDVVVADVDGDVEGEQDAGSPDVEDRNLLARSTLSRADLALVVGEPSMKGVHALVRLLTDLTGLGLPLDRLLPVFSRAPRSPRRRAELSRCMVELFGASSALDAQRMQPPVHLPERPVEAALRDGAPLPGPGPRKLARAVRAVLDRVGEPSVSAPSGPSPIEPGSLPGFTAQDPPEVMP